MSIIYFTSIRISVISMDKQNLNSKKSILGYLAFAIVFSITMLLIILACTYFKDNKSNDEVVNTRSPSSLPTVIIDAGHGGEDGGTVGVNGAYEKDLNLIIASDLCDMLRSCGVNVVMTRTTDTLLYDRNVDYKGRKKVLDLAARLKIAESYENCIFVSIHMNSFPEQRYSGLQVYYSDNSEQSSILAKAIQDSVSSKLQKDNTRKIKSSKGNIFLLDRIKSPAVLIECGFLSNYSECELLSTDAYRKKLTFTLFDGIYNFISEYNS